MAATVLSFAGDAQAKVWVDHNGKNDVAIETSKATGSVVSDINLTHQNLDFYDNVKGTFHPAGEDEKCEISADKLTIGQIAAVKDVLVENDKALETKANEAKTLAGEAKTAADNARAEIAQEVEDRKAADAVLDGKISDEAAARKDADDKLQKNIDAEEQARKDADAVLDGKIEAETERATREEKRIEDKFDKEVSRLDNKIDKLDDRIEKVGAMSAAIANLHTMGYDPAAPTEIAVGVGQYRDKTGLAVGAFHYPNRDFMMSFSVSTAGDEFMAGIGATWKIGRKSPEQMLKAQQEKAAREKLAEAEAMKQAAKDARVAAQQARHAKMLAERSK